MTKYYPGIAEVKMSGLNRIRSHQPRVRRNVVSERGLEPPRGYKPHQILSLARLPIPPLRQEGRAIVSVGSAQDKGESEGADSKEDPHDHREPIQVSLHTVEPVRFDVDIPPPNTSERPPPLPEWSKTSAISARDRITWTMIAYCSEKFHFASGKKRARRNGPDKVNSALENRLPGLFAHRVGGRLRCLLVTEVAAGHGRHVLPDLVDEWDPGGDVEPDDVLVANAVEMFDQCTDRIAMRCNQDRFP